MTSFESAQAHGAPNPTVTAHARPFLGTRRARRRRDAASAHPSRTAWLAPAVLLSLLAHSQARAADSPTPRAWVAGGDKKLWVITTEDAADSSLPIVRMFCGSRESNGLTRWRASPYLPPVAGDPIALAAGPDALHVLFSDLSQRDYSPDRDASPGPPWLDQTRARPLAWASDATRPMVVALVRTRDVPAPTTTASEDETESPPRPTPGPVPDTDLTLLQLRDGIWRRSPGPVDAAQGSRFWLAARDSKVALFWAKADEVRLSSGDAAGWAPSRPVVRREVRHAWVGASSADLAFVASEPGAAPRMQLRLFLDREGGWTDAGLLRDGSEPLSIDPRRDDVAVVCGALGVARHAKGRPVEFGLGELGVSPLIRFDKLPEGDAGLPRGPEWQDSAVLAALLGVLTLALWSRRDQIASPIKVPSGYAPAAVWKRVAATAIDFLPAILILIPWMLPVVAEYQSDGDLFSLRRQLENPALQARLAPYQYATILMYGLWCFLWEFFTATTPGKRLLDCRVWSASGGRPTFRQALIRNLVRVIMVGLGAPGLITTLLMLVLVSRNRQRVGDLLAATLVLEPAPPAESPTLNDEDAPLDPD